MISFSIVCVCVHFKWISRYVTQHKYSFYERSAWILCDTTLGIQTECSDTHTYELATRRLENTVSIKTSLKKICQARMWTSKIFSRERKTNVTELRWLILATHFQYQSLVKSLKQFHCKLWSRNSEYSFIQ